MAVDLRTSEALLALLAVDGVGPVRALAAAEAGDPLGEGFPQRLQRATALADLHRKNGVAVIGRYDQAYPQRLTQLRDTPPVLFCRGDAAQLNRRLVAVVGTRRPTELGNRGASLTVAELARRGFGVVSGMARGVDAIAHRLAIERQLPNVAVMGCGPDRVHPPEHERLCWRLLAAGGAMITEHPAGTDAAARTLLARNRIVCGLARAVVVCETGAGGGTMDTACRAYQLGLPLLAAPGSEGADLLLSASPGELKKGSPQWKSLSRAKAEASGPVARRLTPQALAEVLTS